MARFLGHFSSVKDLALGQKSIEISAKYPCYSMLEVYPPELNIYSNSDILLPQLTNSESFVLLYHNSNSIYLGRN